MITVLRVETVKRRSADVNVGFGAYRAFCDDDAYLSAADKLTSASDYSSTTHPTPGSDPLMSGPWANLTWEEESQYHFGFKDKKQLLTWFNQHDNFGLVQEKYKVHVGVYEVEEDSVIIGLRQVAFNQLNARLVDSISLTEILED